jgi:transcriptional regulator with XRE-family HTH domain
MDRMEAPGQKIKFLREAMGLSTQELAARMRPKPVTRQAVEQWERNGIRTFRMLQRVAEALGVKPDALLNKEG